jgi:gamma-glutamylcyclotransferase (GGCT)/AIG2-like uncharacterized protein YtfP
MSLRIFVYGTLRTNEYYHHIIKDQVTSVTKATYRGSLYHLPFGYPAIVDGDGRIAGELMTFSEAESVLAKLDELEGYQGHGQDNEYERIYAHVQLENGTLTPCQLYIYPAHKREWLQREAILVPSGDWVQWKQNVRG